MELKERIKKALKREFGIENMTDFEKVVRQHEPVDLGIFITSKKKFFNAAAQKNE